MTYKSMSLVGKEPAHADARLWKTYDLDTGEMIRNVIWANDETGEYCVLCLDENGQPYVDGETNELATVVKTSNIQMRKS